MLFPGKQGRIYIQYTAESLEFKINLSDEKCSCYSEASAVRSSLLSRSQFVIFFGKAVVRGKEM